MNIITKIEQSKFLATEADVEAMARARQDGTEFDGQAQGTYLRVLVALTANAIGGKTAHLSRRRGKAATSLTPSEIADHLVALEKVNSMCNGAVVKAVITRDIEASEQLAPAEAKRRALERNRRTNYARTAASAVRAFIQAGRDVRDVELRTVTKAWLRDMATANSPVAATVTTARILRTATRAGERIVAEAEELAGVDPLKAEELLSAVVAMLQETIDKINRGEVPAHHEFGSTTVVSDKMRAAIRAA